MGLVSKYIGIAFTGEHPFWRLLIGNNDQKGQALYDDAFGVIEEYLCGPEKLGQCPPERKLSPRSKWRPVEICHDDSNCEGNKKCCPDNYFKFCKPPAQDTPGSCPPVPAVSYEQCNDNCSANSDCAPGFNCCFHKCGKTCMRTQNERVGECPLTMAQCQQGDNSVVCTGDNNCPNGGKCCDASCGKRCVVAALNQVKKGFCFQEELFTCMLEERHLCVNDSFCQNNEKCCPYLCRSQCMEPLPERNGECPKEQATCTAGDSSIVCTSDYDCPTNGKCCNASCGKRCVKAVNVRTYMYHFKQP
ncbi:uncharacterized protein O3C94_020058 [Discoglossus pictus]